MNRTDNRPTISDGTQFSDTNISNQAPTSISQSLPDPANSVFIPASPLTSSRYNRQILIPSISIEGQTKISRSRVLIIGLGGLGSPASLYLAGAGVHTLGLLDHDVVETSNLHRQIVHRESSVYGNSNCSHDHDSVAHDTHGGSTPKAMTKVASALRGCRELNSKVRYTPHEVQLSNANALDIIREYDVVLDCTDNPATRYLISDCCVVLGKTLVSGAAQRLEGQIVVLNYAIPKSAEAADGSTTTKLAGADGSLTGGISNPQDVTNSTDQKTNTEEIKAERGPCYRCVFPQPPSPEMVKGCSEIGILGPVVGAIGTLMASETLRLICRPDEVRKPTMLLYNAWSADPRGIFRVIGLRGKRKDCMACSSGRDDHDDPGKVDTFTEQNNGKEGGKTISNPPNLKTTISEASIRDGRIDYETFCGRIEDINLLQENERIDPGIFLQRLNSNIKTDNQSKQNSQKAVIIDVRESYEIEIGPKIPGSINIPISRVLRPPRKKEDHNDDDDNELHQILRPEQRDNNSNIYFICQRGNDSQIAARKFIDRERERDRNSVRDEGMERWIGDVKGGFEALEKLVGSRSSSTQQHQ